MIGSINSQQPEGEKVPHFDKLFYRSYVGLITKYRCWLGVSAFQLLLLSVCFVLNLFAVIEIPPTIPQLVTLLSWSSNIGQVICQAFLYVCLKDNLVLFGTETEHVRMERQNLPTEKGRELECRLIDAEDLKGQPGQDDHQKLVHLQQKIGKIIIDKRKFTNNMRVFLDIFGFGLAICMGLLIIWASFGIFETIILSIYVIVETLGKLFRYSHTILRILLGVLWVFASIYLCLTYCCRPAQNPAEEEPFRPRGYSSLVLTPNDPELVNCDFCGGRFVGESTRHVQVHCQYSHTFHKICFQTWNRVSKTCPRCYANLQDL